MTPIEVLGASRRPTPGSEEAAPTADRDDRLLLWTAALFTLAVLVHGADHARRGVDSIGREVFWLGTAAIALEVAVVVLACQRHRLAPLAAAVAGLSLAFGYVAVHFLPGRSWLSDSFTGAEGASPLSWAAASLETVAALALGAVGLVLLRHRGGLAGAGSGGTGPSRGRREAATHPVALAMIAGNLVLLAVSAAQLS